MNFINFMNFKLILFSIVLILINSCEKDKTELPVLTTSQVTGITPVSAICGGVITGDEGSAITARGVCWSFNSKPTISDSKTMDGYGSGSYTSSVTGLSPGTTYFIRAYATNSGGTGYGNTISFTTQYSRVPVLTTSAVSNISYSGATCGGIITDTGNSQIIASGVCWNAMSDPTINDSKTTDGIPDGSFTSSITGLDPNMTYYVRAYATNGWGTGYGNDISFSTLINVTDIDGNVYSTIKIGDQVWMSENLRTTRFDDGSSITKVTDSDNWSHLTNTYFAYCSYNNSASNASIYGYLYTWAAVMKGAAGSNANPSGVQGICPLGWHIPGDAEWKQLEMFLGMSQSQADSTGERGTTEGGKLKEAGTVHWSNPNTGADNSSGFTALPGGNRLSNGLFNYLGSDGYWWSATGFGSLGAWSRSLNYGLSQVSRDNSGNTYGYSVRCIRDN